ncbi:MAG: glycosyltransferase [Firmicutes bacterium]|nr:glycosyltransferase [Bacillota bacterium]
MSEKNMYAGDTVLYIFSDGGKEEKSWKEVNTLRKYLYTVIGFKAIHIIERTCNYYLERNIIEGISQVLTEWNRIIVLEDDICTSPYFLKYINDALDKYFTCKEVMHISGFTNLDIQEKGDTYFTPYMSGWGWATWKDRWQYFTHYQSKEEALAGLTQADFDKIQYGGAFECLKFLDYQPIPWDICWELTIYRHKGFCLTPTHTLVRNIGIYSGTHSRNYRILSKFRYDRPYLEREIKLVNIPIAADPEIEALYPEALTKYGLRFTLLGKIIRFFYLWLFKK